MTLRDLTPDEVTVLQRQCTREFRAWCEGIGGRPVSLEDCYKAAWSTCLKARLRLTEKLDVETEG